MASDPYNNSCLIVGNGGVGMAIAGRLGLMNIPIKYVGRKGPHGPKNRFSGWGKVCYSDIKALSQVDVSKVSLVFFTLKSFDILGAIDRYVPYLKKGVPIVVLGQGAIDDALQKMIKKYPDHSWRLGINDSGIKEISSGIYEIKIEGKTSWGCLDRKKQSLGADHMTAFEKEIIQKDKGLFFQWQTNILDSFHKKWLFDTVIHSLCAAKGHQKQGLLLGDMKALQAVFDEAFRLGHEKWGPWDRTANQLFTEMISSISIFGEFENQMLADIKSKRRTENEYFAKIAEGYRGFEELKKLSVEVEAKTKYKSRQQS